MNATQELVEQIQNPEKEFIGLNVDTQYGFMEEDRNLYVPGAEDEELRYNMEKLTDTLRDNNEQIVHTGDLHTPYDDEIVMSDSDEEPDPAEGKFPPHCADPAFEDEMGVEKGGAEHIEETRPENPNELDWKKVYTDNEVRDAVEGDGEPVLYKGEFDVFEGSNHAEKVIGDRTDAAVVYGVAEDICVNYAVQGLLERDVAVYVAEDAVEALDPEAAEEARNKWQENGAKMMETGEIVEALERGRNCYEL